MANLSTYFPDYHPAMMNFDGSVNEYRNFGITSAGNKFTMIARLRIPAKAGSGAPYIWRYTHTQHRCSLFHTEISHSDGNSLAKILIQNSAGTAICNLISLTPIADGEPHSLFISFDGDGGLATFYVDGINADDTGWGSRVAPTVGTLPSGSSSRLSLMSGAGFGWVAGDMGFFGHREVYLTNVSDFFNGVNPKELDVSGWSEWGGQPKQWNEHGQLDNNLGSDSDMIAYGDIWVGDAGN